MRAYRQRQENEESRKQAEEAATRAANRAAIEMLILTQFAYEKSKVQETGVFTSEDRIEYKGLLEAGEALGFDGRMHSYWEFCQSHPDENGKYYGERHE